MLNGCCPVAECVVVNSTGLRCLMTATPHKIRPNFMEHDNKEVHPQRFCHGCYNICARTISANTSGKHYTPKLVRFQWEEHRDESCGCEKDNRGRNIKKKSPDRPRQLVLDFIASIKEKSPPSTQLELQLRERLSVNPANRNLICPLCQLVLDRPMVIVACNNTVCLECCVNHAYHQPDLSCPCCSMHALQPSTVIPVSPVVTSLLSSMAITCEKCGKSVGAGTYKQLLLHCNSNIISPPPPLQPC